MTLKQLKLKLILEYNMKVIGKGSFIEMSATDRGIIIEIISALKAFGEENLVSYDREIEWLTKLKEL